MEVIKKDFDAKDIFHYYSSQVKYEGIESFIHIKLIARIKQIAQTKQEYQSLTE